MNPTMCVLDLGPRALELRDVIERLSKREDYDTESYDGMVNSVYRECFIQILNVMIYDVQDYELRLRDLPERAYMAHMLFFDENLIGEEFLGCFRDTAIELQRTIYSKINLGTIPTEFLFENVESSYILFKISQQF
jgi:hypothetical protein